MVAVMQFALFLVLGLSFVPNTTAYASCPAGWRKCGNKCFYFGGQERVGGYASATLKCMDLNPRARLASIKSKEENDFVLANMQISSYIGGTDKQVEGEWRWPDNTRFGYTNWAPYEPTGGSEDCTMFEKGTYGCNCWNDIPCDGFRYEGYVCSLDI